MTDEREKKMVQDSVEKRRAALRRLLLKSEVPGWEKRAWEILKNWWGPDEAAMREELNRMR